MIWVDALSQTDIEELERLLNKFGAETFEAYVLLALRIRLHGPISKALFAEWAERWDELTWHRMLGEFERRGDHYYLKRSLESRWA